MWWMANMNDYLDALGLIQIKLLRMWGVFMSRKTNIKPRFWILMTLVVTCMFAIAYGAEARLMGNQQAEIDILQVQYQELRDQNAALDRQLAFSKTDAFIERAARNELGLLKPGEVRFVANADVVLAND